jgi:hypothetical protein
MLPPTEMILMLIEIKTHQLEMSIKVTTIVLLLTMCNPMGIHINIKIYKQ